MGLWEQIKQWIGGTRKPAVSPAPPRVVDDEPEPVVPEMTVEELDAALAGANPPLVLDVREPYEWRQVRFAVGVHIPMNEVPQRLGELPADRAVVVACAHGSRSYGVAAWLIGQGYQASNLRGGITRWAQSGKPVLQGDPATHG